MFYLNWLYPSAEMWLVVPVLSKVQMLEGILIYTTIPPTGCEQRQHQNTSLF